MYKIGDCVMVFNYAKDRMIRGEVKNVLANGMIVVGYESDGRYIEEEFTKSRLDQFNKWYEFGIVRELEGE